MFRKSPLYPDVSGGGRRRPLWHTLAAEDAVRTLATDGATGLSEAEAAAV